MAGKPDLSGSFRYATTITSCLKGHRFMVQVQST